MSLLLICDYECPQLPLLPTLLLTRDECDCCGSPSVSLTLEWLFWGIGLVLHLD